MTYIQSKTYTIHATGLKVGGLIPVGATFWLEAVPGPGTDAAYYFLRCDQNSTLGQPLRDIPMYPVGTSDVKCGRLPTWDHNDAKITKTFMSASNGVRDSGRKSVFSRRLEGTFTNEGHHEIARIYYFPEIEADEDDWLVFDILTDFGAHDAEFEDGTGHGDPKRL